MEQEEGVSDRKDLADWQRRRRRAGLGVDILSGRQKDMLYILAFKIYEHMTPSTTNASC
jgi:hypothetical protein